MFFFLLFWSSLGVKRILNHALSGPLFSDRHPPRESSPSGVHYPSFLQKKCHDPLGFHETFFPEMKKKGMKSKRRGKERKRKVKVEWAMTLFNLEICLLPIYWCKH